MLVAIVVMMGLWVLGMAASRTAGGIAHVFLLIALVLFFVRTV